MRADSVGMSLSAYLQILIRNDLLALDPRSKIIREDDDRSSQLRDIASSDESDAAECAAADLFREFPPTP